MRMDKKHRHVLGFLYDDDNNVLLVRKDGGIPWMRNKLNGVGGRIEAREPAIVAMQREWIEAIGGEAEVLANMVCGSYKMAWREFARLSGREYALHCFAAKYPIKLALATEVFSWHNRGWCVRKPLPEQVILVKADELSKVGNLVHNLCWLIPMAVADSSQPVAEIVAELPENL